MRDIGDGLDETMRLMVLNAAVKEFATSNVGAFTLEGVAARAGVEARLVKQTWSSTPELFAAMLEVFADRHLPVPDTGTFPGDLLEYARSYARTVNTPDGRRLLDGLIVKPEDWDLSDTRAVFLKYRLDRIGVMVQRAIARGECPPDTDPALTIDMLAIGLCLPVLLYDRPVSDEHCHYVVSTLLYGITGKH
jgi:AcrR family transcriptional regulator